MVEWSGKTYMEMKALAQYRNIWKGLYVEGVLTISHSTSVVKMAHRERLLIVGVLQHNIVNVTMLHKLISNCCVF